MAETSGMQMNKDVEARIRAMPGNATCADCGNVRPQWASVSYGILVCLECSGQHRALGVHLSFVRSVQMDSWTERQISAMEKGGNSKLVEFLSSRGIDKSWTIAKKYNTKQAAYYRERLSRLLDGKTEPPPDPGRYDPESGGGDAQGAEPLPGESPEDYNARQARLREAARERLREKFGEQGLSGVGSSPLEADEGLDIGAVASSSARAVGSAAVQVGGAVGGAAGKVGGVMGDAVTGVGSFLKSSVIENTELHSQVKGAVGGVGETVGSTWGSLRKTVTDGDVIGSLKRNATAEEGSTVSKGLGWTWGAVGGLMSKASSTLGDIMGEGEDDIGGGERGQVPQARQAPRCKAGHQLRTQPRSDKICDVCGTKGTRYQCSSSCDFDMCTKCFDKPPPMADEGDGDAGEEDLLLPAEPPPVPTNEDIERIAKELGMDLNKSTEASGRASTARTFSVAAPAEEKQEVDPAAPSAMPVAWGEQTPPKAKAKAKPAATGDDFFAEFGA